MQKIVTKLGIFIAVNQLRLFLADYILKFIKIFLFMYLANLAD